MSRIASPADSPLGHDHIQSEDEWNFINVPGSSSQTDSSSVAFFPSPASRSLASYGVVIHRGQGHRGTSLSPALNQSPEPLPLQLPPTSSPAQTAAGQQPTIFSTSDQQTNSFPIQFSNEMSASIGVPSTLGASAFSDNQYVTATTEAASDGLQQQFLQLQDAILYDQQFRELAPFFSDDLTTVAPSEQQQSLFSIPDHLQSGADVPPWDPTSVPDPQENQMFAIDGYSLTSLSPTSSFASASASASISQSASPRSPAGSRVEAQQQPQQLQLTPLQQLQLQEMQQQILQFQQTQQPQVSLVTQQQQSQQSQQLQQSQLPLSLALQSTSIPISTAQAPTDPGPAVGKLSPSNLMSKPIPSRSAQGSINKVRGTSNRVTKKKASSGSSSSEKLQLSGSHSSSSGDDKFVIFTPKTISTHTGSGSRFNPFECFEAMSATQKGRKGPLAEEVKESALQVICWRFDDFLAPLFPGFMRKHLRKDEITAFVSGVVASFNVDGVDRLHTAHLTSGQAFQSTLEIKNTKIYKTTQSAADMRHTRLTVNNNIMHLEADRPIPISLDLSESSAISASLQQEKIKKALRVYIESILKEDVYVLQVTGNIQDSELPKKILTIVRQFYLRTSSPIVKQALYIYTMQYMMTVHLMLTPQTLRELAIAGLSLSDTPFPTSRVLNRQIKGILDEMMQDDVDKLFKMFARELKPKARTAWATCLAAFLVFCLFMEATGLSFERFAMTENETDIRNHQRRNPNNARSFAVKLSRELENLPFRQFAYQFHNLYQTHQTAISTSASSSASSPSSSGAGSSVPTAGSTSAIKAAFNPLDKEFDISGELDKPAGELVEELRKLLDGDSWSELDFLCFDDLLGVVEDHPFPWDSGFKYNGRLCSKFLLSFHSEHYIFTPA